MVQTIVNLVRVNAKSIVAAVAAFLVAVFGFDVPVDVQVAVTTLIVAAATWLVPNKG